MNVHTSHESVHVATYRIRNVAVLGAGQMGASIACHLAGVGFQVYLYDLPTEGAHRNQGVEEALRKCLKGLPSPIYKAEFAHRIQTLNYTDHWELLSHCDWIIEVVVEDVEVKRKLFEKIDATRKPGCIISSNTSSIPMHALVYGRSESFKEHFIGTHFFNPPRYMSLLEIIPCEQTSDALLQFMLRFGFETLGKQTIHCKDTPGFIANRIGLPVTLMQMHLAKQFGLDPMVADKLTGTAIGRPKTGTFQLADWVGLDVAYRVLKTLQSACTNDRLLMEIPVLEELEWMIQQGWFGRKAGKGFYWKSDMPDAQGKKALLAFQWNDRDYGISAPVHLESLAWASKIESLDRRLPILLAEEDAGAKFLRASFAFLWAYSAQHLFEIAHQLHDFDKALREGFGWTNGPFQCWDMMGLDAGIQLVLEAGYQLPEWVFTMKQHGHTRFYIEDGELTKCYNPRTLRHDPIAVPEQFYSFNIPAKCKVIFQNDELRLHDLDDGVLCAEFTSRNNIIGGGILTGLQQAIHLAEQHGWKGLVIGNQAKNFTVGADLLAIGMMAFQKDWEQLEKAVRLFQTTSMLCRYSTIPVVLACQGYTFGGGVELLMHCDGAVASAESYIGLVEAGVGLIPGGGGTKEFARRLGQEFNTGPMPTLIPRFKTLATAAVSTSAHEAFDLGYLDASRDIIDIPGLTNVRKAKQLILHRFENYLPPVEQPVQVLGKSGMATLLLAGHSFWRAGFASDHDLLIAQKLAYVVCGGDLSYPQNVSEQYLLDLECEAFISLCSEDKTLARIQFMLENRKPLRN